MSIAIKTFERDHLVASPLILDSSPPHPTIEQWATAEFWRAWLRTGLHGALTFSMIGRLAELLVRTNPMARVLLRLTYSHLFMDEFQDTTQVQYDLAKTIFAGSSTVVTAVGDKCLVQPLQALGLVARLGIAIERIKPGHPQQNGRHERMHLTLKREATRPPGQNSFSSRTASTLRAPSSTPNDRTRHSP